MISVFDPVKIAFLSSYENIILILALIRIAFLSSYKLFGLTLTIVRTAFFSLYRSENAHDNYKNLKRIIVTIITNP